MVRGSARDMQDTGPRGVSPDMALLQAQALRSGARKDVCARSPRPLPTVVRSCRGGGGTWPCCSDPLQRHPTRAERKYLGDAVSLAQRPAGTLRAAARPIHPTRRTPWPSRQRLSTPTRTLESRGTGGRSGQSLDDSARGRLRSMADETRKAPMTRTFGASTAHPDATSRSYLRRDHQRRGHREARRERRGRAGA